MIVNLNINEQLFPKLLELDEDKLNDTVLFLLNIGYQSVFSSVNETNLIQSMDNTCRKIKDEIILGVDSKNELIKDRIQHLQNNVNDLDINTKIDEFSKILEKLFGISASSSKKGEISEDLIYKILSDKYPNYCYDVKRHIAHHADGELTSPTGMKCLVEIKNYSNTVNKDEITKFKYDLKYTGNKLGIFISLQTGVCGRKNIDYEMHQDGDEIYHIIYISKMMEEVLKLDCGILLLESLYKINTKDNLDLKIDQIKNVIYHNFNELELVINKTDKLRSDYDILEKSLKSSMDIFYNNLRSYEIELKQNMQKIWVNLFNDLKDIDKNYIDTKLELLSVIGEKDKCYIVISRIFDLLTKYNINITYDNSCYYMNKGEFNVGSIKKMKDKVVITLENPSITITFKSNDDNNTNFDFMELLINKI
jgi:hypothetical protein